MIRELEFKLLVNLKNQKDLSLMMNAGFAAKKDIGKSINS